MKINASFHVLLGVFSVNVNREPLALPQILLIRKLLLAAPLPSPLGRVAERQRGRERCRPLKRTSNKRLTPPQPQCAHWGSSPRVGAKGLPANNNLQKTVAILRRGSYQ